MWCSFNLLRSHSILRVHVFLFQILSYLIHCHRFFDSEACQTNIPNPSMVLNSITSILYYIILYIISVLLLYIIIIYVRWSPIKDPPVVVDQETLVKPTFTLPAFSTSNNRTSSSSSNTIFEFTSSISGTSNNQHMNHIIESNEFVIQWMVGPCQRLTINKPVDVEVRSY